MSWARLARVTAPQGSPLALADLKRHLRVDYTDDDALIEGYARAALAQIEGPRGAGICLLTQQWRLSLDGLPCRGGWRREPSIEIPMGPVVSIDGVTYLDTSGDLQTLDPALYVYDLDARPVRIVRAFQQSWPACQPQPGSVKVTFTAGFGDKPGNVPHDLKVAAMLLVGHWYEHREAVVGVDARDSSTPLPLGVDRILDAYRPALVI